MFLLSAARPAAVPDGLRVWHKSGVMTSSKGRRAPRPLTHEQLQEVALAYAGRYATTRAKLRTYLARKIRERGWDGPADPDLAGIADRFAELGYVNDAAFALSKAEALAGRGYGKRRLVQKLYAAGVGESDSEAARRLADEEEVAAAMRFAERRRLGPFASDQVRDRKEKEKAVAAMVRAGHRPALAWTIVGLAPDTEIDIQNLSDCAQRSEE